MYLVSRERKQATLDAFNLLQEQVFDKLKHYYSKEIREISQNCKKNWNIKKADSELTEKEKQKREHDLSEYIVLSGYLARIEHFALGVNTGIYDTKIAERAATKHLVIMYRGKLKPLMK